MIVVTGATGKLGRLVVQKLLEDVPPARVVAAVRDPAKAADLSARGVQVRVADYTRPETLGPALEGAEKVLLVSATEVGQRARQHAAVIEAAKQQTGIRLFAYTSILHADTSPMLLAAEHRETEQAIRAAKLPYVMLRNGWYLENYTENLAPALQYGAILGSAGEGRIAAAARADFAAAAAQVLTGSGHEGKAYELAGDAAFTMAELAAEVSRQSGKTVVYKDVAPNEYEGALAGFGLPPAMAKALADSDVHAQKGALEDRSGDLRRLIGRPTTTLAEAVAAALRS